MSPEDASDSTRKHAPPWGAGSGQQTGTIRPIAFNAIKPGKGRDYLTLFTTGMSDEPMTVPEGEEEWKYAEFFVQAPADWNFGQDDGMHPDIVWLMQSIRNLAGTVHET